MSSKKLTSIVVLAYNEIEYTKLCIDSIFQYTDVPFELVLVDNGSTDGTGDYFDSIPGAKVVKNSENLGFGKGCNMGIEMASGDYILLLNNDTVVSESWLDNLVRCMESNPNIGLVGPMSNYVAGIQQIQVSYGDSIEAMLEFARQFNQHDPSKYIETSQLIGFCLLMRRSVVDKIGLFDERFGLGNFEDNDFCIRAVLAGFKLMIAGDTFIHHFGSRTFIGNSIDYNELIQHNGVLFKEKWEDIGGVSSHDMAIAKATLACIKEKIIDKDPVEAYSEGYLQEPWRYPDKHVDSPTLSLAMIVKDEEDDLGRCLESVKDVVDEIIIVDTGSTDRTVEIAKSYGAKIFFHKWTGNFAEARNVSLDQATCDWVMFLDADEELVKGDGSRLRDILFDPIQEGFYFTEFNFIGEKESDGAIINPAFRLWRNKPQYRFSSPIHEQIVAAVQTNNPNIGFSDIRINHYGYLSKVTLKKDKVQRNLNILLKEVEKNPNDSFVRFNLGVEYLRLRDHEEALEHYQKAFANLQGLDVAYASMLIRNIGLCLKELGRYTEALRVLRDAREAYPDYTDLFYLEGTVYLAQKDFISAISCFKTCLEMGSAGMTHITQTGVGGHMAAHALAQAYKALGDEQAVVNSYKKALEDNPRDCMSITELGLMLVHRESPVDLRQFLEKLVDMHSEDVLFTLSFIFSQGGHHDISLSYLDKLIDMNSSPSRTALSRGECLLNLKRYQEAIEEFNKVAESSQYNPAASIDKAVCYLIEGDYENASKALNAIKDDSDFSLVYSLYFSLINLSRGSLPLVSIRNDQKQQAEKIISDLLRKLLELEEFELFEGSINLLEKINFSSGEISLLLGKIYYDVGYNDMAVEELIRAHENGCADGDAFFMLGKTALDNNFLEEAKMFFLEAIDRGIEELTLYTSLARTLIKLSEPGPAIEVLDTAAKKYPNSPLVAEIRRSVSALVT